MGREGERKKKKKEGKEISNSSKNGGREKKIHVCFKKTVRTGSSRWELVFRDFEVKFNI